MKGIQERSLSWSLLCRQVSTVHYYCDHLVCYVILTIFSINHLIFVSVSTPSTSVLGHHLSAFIHLTRFTTPFTNLSPPFVNAGRMHTCANSCMRNIFTRPRFTFALFTPRVPAAMLRCFSLLQHHMGCVIILHIDC